MERHLQLFPYVFECITQTQIAEVGVARINDEVSAADPSMPSVLSGAQTILTAAAQISKLMWADTKKEWSAERIQFAVDRASELRKLLKPHRVLQRRAVRNAIEHLDERLDTALFAGKNIVMSMFGPVGTINAPTATVLRHLDPQRMSFAALDEEVDLQQVVDAMRSVQRKAEAWVEQQEDYRRIQE